MNCQVPYWTVKISTMWDWQSRLLKPDLSIALGGGHKMTLCDGSIYIEYPTKQWSGCFEKQTTGITEDDKHSLHGIL